MTLWYKLDLVARNLSPLAITLLLVVIGVLPVPVSGLQSMAPALSLIAVYYWSIFRPDLIPSWAVFGVGLFQDILTGTPLGVYALVLLLVRATVVSRRRFFMGSSFFVMWGGFLLVSAGALALVWELVSLLNTTIVNPTPALFQYVLTLALFPCFIWLFTHAQRAFLRQA